MSSISVGSHGHDLHAEHAHEHAHTAGFISTYVFSRDHKIIGIQFLFSTLIWFLDRRDVGAWRALAVGVAVVATCRCSAKLYAAEGGQIAPEAYTMLFTMHATVMIFLVIIPILAGAFGNFLIPLMIGADDMAFPTLNMLSYWFMWPAFLCFGGSFFVEGYGASSGWTVYPPLSVNEMAAPGSGTAQTLWVLGLIFVGVSSMMGSVNYMTTIIQMRAPGMTMFRLPLTIWAMMITAILQAFALPVLTAAGFMQLMDRTLGHRLLLAGRQLDQQHAARRRRRAAAVVAAPVLVLFAPGRVHHDSAGDGHGVGHHRGVRAEADLRLQADGVFDRRDRRSWVHRVGPPHVHVGNEPGVGADVHGLDDADRVTERD